MDISVKALNDNLLVLLVVNYKKAVLMQALKCIIYIYIYVNIVK